MNNNFVTNDFEKYINDNVLNNYLPKLNHEDKNDLLNLLIEIINFISIRYDFVSNSTNDYLHQLKQNKNRDIIALLNLILPYINDSGKSKLENLRSLEELYSIQNTYTNIQYSRCKRFKGEFDGKYNEPISYKYEHLKQNVELLKYTIFICANKTYVNWTNILPIGDNFRDFNIYKNTKQYMDADELSKLDSLSGRECILPFSDMYSVIVIDLYDKIKKYKWLLYNKLVNGRPIPYVIILNHYIDIDIMLKKKEFSQWDYIGESRQSKFEIQWINFKNNILKNDTVKALFISLFYFFQRYSNPLYIQKLESDGLFKRYPFEKTDDFKIPKENDVDIHQLIGNISNTPANEIYNFIYKTIGEFKKTWYNNDIIITDNKFKSIDDDVYYAKDIVNNFYVTLKDIYNYSKLVCTIYVNNKSHKYPVHWPMCTEDIRISILDNFEIASTKFNIKRIIKNVYEITDERKIDAYNSWIYREIRKNIVDIVFQVLTRKGVLSYFKPNKELTDDMLLPANDISKTEEIKKRMKKYIFSNKHFAKCNYYLTHSPYEELKFDNPVDNYFDTIIGKNVTSMWTTMYAMDWVSQIGFFHHYIHNSVIYITGGTGTGKSTQIPKLLLYCQLAIDYRDESRVICTQPRIPPTEKNAQRIASEMGVPLKTFSKKYKTDIMSDNFYIQYKHQRGNHLNSNEKFYLKIVTDGTLLEELITYPFCKEIAVNADGQEIYSDKNMYDILIVDEAHEHNTNMDLILTLARYAVYYNNSIKLVIISATMDEDEPIYRRYFRCINDNRSYPLSQFLKENEYDRINVDRRHHISPYGQDTRFKITEIYEKKLRPEQKTWEWSYNRGIKHVINICNTTIDGGILFFVTGEKEINDAMEIINRKIPYNVLCLPYYGELSTEKKNLVENIDTHLKTYIINKNDSTKTVPLGTYKRYVIVATNIAEASITIPSLRYVVETGYAKVNKYEYKLGMSNLENAEISESSRKQRKGRVGRVSDGIVYYTYENGGRADNMTEYKIVNENIWQLLYKLLCNDSINEDILINKDMDPNNVDTLRKLNDYYDELTKPLYFKIKKFIETQYIEISVNYNKDGIARKVEHKLYYYYGNDSQYDWGFDGFGYRPPDRLLTGYDKETLMDITGEFYIIHPQEDIMKEIRDTLTGYIPKNLYIWSLKIVDFFQQMKEQLMIMEYDRDYVDIFIIYQGQRVPLRYNGHAQKTLFGEKLINFCKPFSSIQRDFEPKLITPYLYGELYECQDEILHLICMIISGRGEMKSWYDIKKQNKFNDMYRNDYGDYIILYKIYQKLRSTFPFLKIYNIYENNFDSLLDDFNKKKYIYLHNRNNNKLELKEFLKFRKLDLSNKFVHNNKNNFNDFVSYLDDNNDYLMSDIAANKSKIEEFCAYNYLESNTVIRYLEEYARFRNSIALNDFKTMNDIKDKEEEVLVSTQWFRDNLKIIFKHNLKEINIILSFLHGYGKNIGCKYEDTYTQVFYRNLLKLDNSNINSDYIMYHSARLKDGAISANIINYIKFEWFIKTVPYISNLAKIASAKYTDRIDYYNGNIMALYKFQTNIKNNISKIITYLRLSMNNKDSNYFKETIITDLRIQTQLGGTYSKENVIIVNNNNKQYNYKLTFKDAKLKKIEKIDK